MKVFFVVIFCALTTTGFAAQCPSGSAIYQWGISEQGKIDVTNRHNKYRQMIMNGQVPNQPRGKNLKTMTFDNILANSAKQVSQQCARQHVTIKDSRFSWVGQNLYMEHSTQYNTTQDWKAAVDSWYNEYKNFVYPNGTNGGGMTGHYTQVVWDASALIGCDYILYNDLGRPEMPFTSLYTCNYGPGGNYVGQAPYQKA